MTGRREHAAGPATREGRAAVQGRHLHWTAAGSGAPTVVLEAGLSASSRLWEPIAEQLAEDTTVVTYDRAGYGRSDAVAAVRADQVVDDLRCVLRDAAAPGPMILVGHSWGGALLRLYAAEHPSDVAALVLLDATHERLKSSQSATLTKVNVVATYAMALHARLGLGRRSLDRGKGDVGRVLQALPEERRREVVDELSQPARWVQARRELRSTHDVLARLAATPPTPVPVVAVVGSKATSLAESRQRRELQAVYEQWLAGLPDGRLVLAPNSGHAVPLHDRQLVVDVVRGLVRQVREVRQ